jgi:hypothetical protein
MANISAVNLKVEAIPNDPSHLKVTATYILSSTSVERLAGSVFQSTIGLYGDDPWFDLVRFEAADGPFGVSINTPTVTRSRVFILAKSVFNEDSETLINGSEVTDEIYARVTAKYVANAPVPVPVIGSGTSPTLTGVWK